MPALLTCLTLLLGISSSSPGPPKYLHPYEVASPSREYRLTVDPSNRLGRGEGLHRLFRHDEVVWSRMLESTFWNACVSDTGRVVGYAYPQGLQFGPLVIMEVENDGELLFEHPLERRSPGPGANPVPWVSQLFFDPLINEFVIGLRGGEDFPGEGQYWILDAQFGIGEDARPPETFFPGADHRWSRVQEIRSLQGTDLRLVWRWIKPRYSLPERSGAHFSLIDAKGREVWSRRDEGDYFHEDRGYRRRLFDAVRKQGALLATDAKGHFAVWDVTARERIDYRVERTASGWKVEESGRSAFQGELSDDWLLAQPERLQLELVEEVELDLGGLELPRLGYATIDSAGRVLVGPHREPALIALDLAGEVRWIAQIPKPERYSGRYAPSVSPSGEIYLDNGSYRDPGLYHLSSEGELLGRADLPPTRRICFAEDRSLWYHTEHYRDEAVTRIDRNGSVLARVRRTPGNRWFEGTLRCHSDPDGSLTVLNAGVLARYSPEGEPLSERRVPSGYLMRMGPHWVALGSSSSVTLVSRQGDEIYQSEIAGQVAGFSPDGCLVTLDGERGRLLFYRLP